MSPPCRSPASQPRFGLIKEGVNLLRVVARSGSREMLAVGRTPRQRGSAYPEERVANGAAESVRLPLVIAEPQTGGWKCLDAAHAARSTRVAPLIFSSSGVTGPGWTVDRPMKHAGPAQVNIVLHYQPSNLEIEIVDDGRAAQRGSGGWHGLPGLGERVAVFGGRFEAGSQPEGGWRIRASFPTTP